MNVDLLLRCPACGSATLAGDAFCEACGATIAPGGETSRHHFEVDRGTVAGASHRGLVHDRNDDALDLDVVAGASVIAVCDGVSASTAADVAAQVAATAAAQRVGTALHQRAGQGLVWASGGWSAAEVVKGAIAGAADAVAALPWQTHPDRDAPSCTMVVAVWDGLDLTVGWVGDSRAYWADDHGCRPLTVDHSWAVEQVNSGRLSRAAAEADGRAHAITRWLGADAPPGPCPVETLRPAGPGRLVVCTDGLWNYTPEAADLAQCLREVGAASPLATARALVRYALSRGGHDNVTVAVADLVPPVLEQRQEA